MLPGIILLFLSTTVIVLTIEMRKERFIKEGKNVIAITELWEKIVYEQPPSFLVSILCICVLVYEIIPSTIDDRGELFFFAAYRKQYKIYVVYDGI